MPALDIAKAAQAITSKPLVALDMAMESLEGLRVDESSDALNTLLGIFTKATLAAVGISSAANDPIEQLFDKERDRQAQRFIAICLLRLLSAQPRCLRSGEYHFKAMGLIDDLLADDLYALLKINRRDQTYEKVAKLSDGVRAFETELSKTILSISSMESIASCRPLLMQKANSQLAKSLLEPFLPTPPVLQVRLNEMFSAADAYRSDSGASRLNAYRTAIDALQDQVRVATAFGTKYSRAYLAALASRMHTALVEDFAKSTLSKPATLSVAPFDKKYPFQAASQRFNIRFVVSNAGPGHAFETNVKITGINDDVYLPNPDVFLGTVPRGNITVEFPCEVKRAENIALGTFVVTWRNFDGTARSEQKEFELQAQRTDIDWTSLAAADPYSLEPVTSFTDLAGRSDVLEDLITRITGRTVSSFFIYGQKRVGKTSIARTLASQLRQITSRKCHCIYLEGGDYVHPDPAHTVTALGTSLCERLREADPRFASIAVPPFAGALTPLVGFLDNISRIAPDDRVVFVLDEFDELPSDLYRSGSLGNSLFLTLRSISGKEPFGFVLIGGEKMEFILNSQGDALNKFQAIRVDYFDKHSRWADFTDLVRRPVQAWKVEVSDRAIESLYEQTAGNPYFTKLICRELLGLMIDRRDAHVTHLDVQDAIPLTVSRTAANSFMHFWKDGIADAPRTEELSAIRRRILLALADALRKHGDTGKDRIVTEATKYGLSAGTVERELREFERRKVLTFRASAYHCKVPLFQTWLKDRGVDQIIASFAGADAGLEELRQSESLRVQSQEITALTQSWGTYRGVRITEDQVRSWLEQFGEPPEQRLMFTLLQHVKFYTHAHLRQKIVEAHGIVTRGTVRKMEEGKLKRSDILISYLDGPAKSGAQYAKLYADENSIYADNVIELGKLKKTLSDRDDFQVLVFIDDIIGSGKSGETYLTRLHEDCGDIIRERQLKLCVIGICGLEAGKTRVEHTAEKLGLPVRMSVCDPLGDDARCFSDSSPVFSDPISRQRARELAIRYGSRLEKSAPLGYADGQLLVVFESNCPNNSLPVLWKRSKEWSPLFERV